MTKRKPSPVGRADRRSPGAGSGAAVGGLASRKPETEPQETDTPKKSGVKADSTTLDARPVRTRRVRRLAWRRVAWTGAALIGVGGIAALAVWSGAAAPAADTIPPGATSVRVAAPSQSWVCPGPARLTDAETVGDAEFGPSPVGTTTTLRAGTLSSTSAKITGLDGRGARSFAGNPLATTAGRATEGSLIVATAADGADPDPVWASVSSVTTEGDLRGLAAATCARPGVEHWLVGGTTTVGSSTQLVIQNPGRTPATVTIDVWGPTGPVAVTGGAQRLIRPGAEVVTLVEAVAPQLSRVVVRVTAAGGLVTTYLQQNSLDGLVPQGVDFVVPGAPPSKGQVISSVLSLGEEVDDPRAPRLRVLAQEAGMARVVAYGKDGMVPLRGAEAIDLEAGVVSEISLGGLPSGSYAIAVTGDVSLVAAAYQDRQGPADPQLLHAEHQYDRAWIASRSLAEDAGVDLGGIALPEGAGAAVTIGAVPRNVDEALGSVPAAELTLRAYDTAGAVIGTKHLSVPAGATAAFAASSVASSGTPAYLGLTADGPVDERLMVDWSVLAASGHAAADTPAPDGSLIAVLRPATTTAGDRTVHVRASVTAGLAGAEKP